MAGFTSKPQWRRLREQILERDNHRCQIRGPRCKGEATEVDHIIPVRDGGPIYDPNNCRAACDACNTWRAQRQKSREGWKRSATRVILVMGPPAAGKSTHVAEHATSRDLVIDYDAISRALGPTEAFAGRGVRHGEVMKLRNQLLHRVRRGEIKAARVWIVSSHPAAERMFPHHEIRMIDPGESRVLEQAAASRPAQFATLIRDWYARRAALKSPAPTSREW